MEKKYDFRFPNPEMEIAGGKYILKSLEPIGEGAFGKIFLGKIKETNEFVAIKLEIPDMIRSQLEIEYKIYSILKGGGKKNIKFI
jgi:predicted Ser/Thr protein kinase